MQLAEFEQSLPRAQPPAGLMPALRALWWAHRGDWNKAHEIVMDEASREAAWVHAYLHRCEGDLDNARYWYAKAKQPPAAATPDAEWRAIAAALLEQG